MSNYDFTVKIPDICFGEFDFGDKENGNTFALSLKNVSEKDCFSYKNVLIEYGFSVFESRIFGCNSFTALKKADDAVYITYYPSVAEMRIVTEKNSTYINYSDNPGIPCVSSNITQINLLDFGISYVIRLNDGRFIIFDGGWDWDCDTDELMKVLNENSIAEKPVIAAWILTHQHSDHFWAFNTFHKKYGNNVKIEKVLLNFAEPTPEFVEKYPGSFLKAARGAYFDFTKELFKCIEEKGADVYCPHSGQIYQIGNALCEILSSPDDTCRTPVTDVNPLSLMIKMTIEGQTILWCADGYFEPSKLPERYGTYLKSDIMQLPHHGFIGGTSEGYDFINPRVVLAPTFDDDAFVYINIHKEDNWHLCTEMNVEEYICGKKYNGCNHTITLPYEPNPKGREKLVNMVKDGLGFCGAKVWYFDGLILEENKDCMLNIIRSCRAFDVYVDFIFENPKFGATAVKVDISKSSLTRFNLNEIEVVENNPLQYERTFWRKSEIPTNVPFAIRVYANTPFVASCDSGKEIYHY